MTANPAIVVGGTNAQGTITLTAPAPSGGAVVTLGSSDPTSTQVPGSVTLPANAISATFPITTVSVATATPVTITGNYNGSAQAGFTVNPGSLISQAGWSLLAVDSQETLCFNGSGHDSPSTATRPPTGCRSSAAARHRCRTRSRSTWERPITSRHSSTCRPRTASLAAGSSSMNSM